MPRRLGRVGGGHVFPTVYSGLLSRYAQIFFGSSFGEDDDHGVG